MKHSNTLRSLVPFLIGLLPLSVHPSHIVGSDLGYVHVGGSDYEVTLTLFRDCSGISAPGTGLVSLSSVSCQVSTSVVLPFLGSAYLETGCPGLLSTCQGGSYPGLEIVTYRDTVTLPMPCSDWEFRYADCCRNAALQNIVNPSSQGASNTARLDNLNFPGNSSPVFQQLHRPFICSNGNYCLDNGAYDADGDSLVYSTIAPMDDNGFPLSYVPGHSTADPFPSVNGHAFDPFTGNHCSEPMTSGAYALAYRVDEYRNGVLVGSVMRDLQVWVANCPGSTLGFAGTVADTSGVPVASGTVELYTYGLNSAGSLLYGGTTVNGNGQYAFTNVPYGQYILRAIPDSLQYPNTATSYFMNTHYWTYAEMLSAICDSTFSADIQLVGFGDLVGSGVVIGYLGDLGIVRSGGFGDPWPGVSVLLESYPSGALVASTWTRMDGTFSFTNVPFGTYRLMLDHPGLPMLGHYIIEVTPGQPVHSGMDHAAYPEGFLPQSGPTAVQGAQGPAPVFGPNPLEDNTLRIRLAEDGVRMVRLFDGAGRQVYGKRSNVQGGVLDLVLPDLASGTYLMDLGNASAPARLVVP